MADPVNHAPPLDFGDGSKSKTASKVGDLLSIATQIPVQGSSGTPTSVPPGFDLNASSVPPGLGLGLGLAKYLGSCCRLFYFSSLFLRLQSLLLLPCLPLIRSRPFIPEMRVCVT